MGTVEKLPQPETDRTLARSQVAQLILERLADLQQRLARVEHDVGDIADDLDAFDRAHRPYGDGSRPPRRRPR